MLKILFKRFNYKGAKSFKPLKEHIQIIQGLQQFLGFKINNAGLYLKALTHRSYLPDLPENSESNERLEFLGDSLIGFILAEYLFTSFKTKDEGFLTKTRSYFVNRETLANTAEMIGLGRFVLYNHKFLNDSGAGLMTILADALEALVGAIYLDKGLIRTKSFVMKWIVEPNIERGKYPADTNYKGQLLEFTHSNKIGNPVYTILNESGPDHDKLFTITVHIDDKILGTGIGKNKKSAEQQAAKVALSKIREKVNASK